MGNKPKSKCEYLTRRRANELLDYSPETGEFRWKATVRIKSLAGRIAGATFTHRRTSYRKITIGPHQHSAHRLAWFITHGRWPKNQIDHINGDGLDNRLCNLREATASQNQRNARLRKDNKTGFKGVYFNRVIKRYRSTISHNKCSKHLGYFNSPEEAHEAYCKAAKEIYGEFANTGRGRS